MQRREWMQLWMLAAPAAAQHAHEQMALPPGQRKLKFFTQPEADRVADLASIIIPSDEGPGAREAGVVYFIDALLTTAPETDRAIYRTGLATKQNPKEGDPFFETIRTHTIMGFLSDPRYGGNIDEAGWRLIGFENKMGFTPPFGHYDAEGSK